MNTTEALPVAPGALPLVGHAIALLRDPLAFLTSLPNYGDMVQIRLGPLAAVIVCDRELTRQVLLDDRTYDKGGPIFDRTREVVGDSLGTCPHSRHRRQRRLTQPAFHPTRFPGYAQNISAEIAAVTTIAYSPYLIQHRPDLYESPEQFNPDRWDATRYPPPPRNGAIPFAAGARKCIGDQFAITEATPRPGCHHGALEPATPALPGTTHHRCRAEPTETADAPCCPYKAS